MPKIARNPVPPRKYTRVEVSPEMKAYLTEKAEEIGCSEQFLIRRCMDRVLDEVIADLISADFLPPDNAGVVRGLPTPVQKPTPISAMPEKEAPGLLAFLQNGAFPESADLPEGESDDPTASPEATPYASPVSDLVEVVPQPPDDPPPPPPARRRRRG